MMRRAIEILVTLGLFTAAALLAPWLPAPLGFWCGLAVVLLGPGAGLPRILFPPGVLSWPERAFITVLASLFLSTAVLAALNALGVALTPTTTAAAVLAPTYLTVLLGALRWRGQGAGDGEPSGRPAWGAFGGGIALGASVALVALRWLSVWGG